MEDKGIRLELRNLHTLKTNAVCSFCFGSVWFGDITGNVQVIPDSALRNYTELWRPSGMPGNRTWDDPYCTIILAPAVLMF